ncbi:hypothetical protein CDAR_597191 [Caerostris darwini]|uniref:Uncharacterized protein n=1 Tax=Caerostris darwini TaxID=1538125 RepID=A0AAV4U2C2_9ARAC|nr:hypothetical protein CDAR_597191 [Caerostris darwini]
MPPPGLEPEACDELAIRSQEEEQVTPEMLSERSLDIPAYVPTPRSKNDSLIFRGHFEDAHPCDVEANSMTRSEVVQQPFGIHFSARCPAPHRLTGRGARLFAATVSSLHREISSEPPTTEYP